MKYFKLTVIAFFVASISACGGGSGDDSPVDSVHLDHTNARSLVKNTDTGNMAIGVIDSGLNSASIRNPVTPVMYNELRQYDRIGNWKFADHGNNVTEVALSYARNSPIVFAQWRNYRVNPKTYPFVIEYFGYPEISGELTNAKGECLAGVGQGGITCLTHATFWSREILQHSDRPISAINLSFSSRIQQIGTWITEESLTLPERLSIYHTWGLPRLPSPPRDYTELQKVLSKNDVVLVMSAGNDVENLSEQSNVAEYLNAKQTATDESIKSLTHYAYDFDHDDNNNGVIEDSERGITDALIFVGGFDTRQIINGVMVDKNMKHKSSAIPGSNKNIQDRFILASFYTEIHSGEKTMLFRGTSAAAPQVTGAITLLKSIFPHKTAREIAQAILDSANKEFIPNHNPEIHGQGVLDVESAKDLLSRS